MIINVFGQSILLVCKPGTTQTREIQADLDALLGTGKATVFGRIADLESMTSTTAPDAMLLVPETYYEFQTEYELVLVGKYNKEAGEKHLIVSESKNVTKNNLNECKIGVLDFLGRERLKKFIKAQFNIEPKIIQRVNKNEDLLTMLGMETVDAIIVSTTEYKEILTNTKIHLTIVSESTNPIGFIICASKKDCKNKTIIKNALLKAPVALKAKLNITDWEER
jgi:hypothetical protein